MRDRLPVAFRINGERLVILGWTRAILLQFAHPLIAAGVYDHSGFRDSPAAAVTRLAHTTTAMLSITFGDEGRQQTALAGIRRIHTRVHGTLRDTVGPYPAGTPYSAEDPALLLWVHATLVESMIRTYETLVGPLTPDERDEYCDASVPPAVTLGMHDADAPRSWHELQEFLRQMYASGAIVVGPQARELADALLRTSIPALLAPARWIPQLMAAAMLPPHLRSAYGLRWSAARARRFDRFTAAVRGIRRATPDIVALWPDARRLAAGG